SLSAGDRIHATVNTQPSGSSLQSVLRIFDPSGNPVALNDQKGGDPQLTFQAATPGTYTIGVSSAGNNAYVLSAGGVGQGGSSPGMYPLHGRLTPHSRPQAALTSSSFRLLSESTAAWGDTVNPVQVSFTIENHGDLPADATAQVQLLLSDSTTFTAP